MKCFPLTALIVALCANFADGQDDSTTSLGNFGQGPLVSQIEKMAMSQGANAASARSLATVFATAASRQIKLTGVDGAVGDQFGVSVSLAGNRALIGAAGHDGVAQDSGAAYIFSTDGRTWTQEAELIPSDTAQFQVFGQSVSLVGTRALIGAPGDYSAGQNVGAAYIYDLVGSSWIQSAKLTPSNPNLGGYFGGSVSLTGNRALIGAQNANRSKGKAYVFDFNGTTWSQSASLTDSGLEQYDSFGHSVSLSGDRALVGTSAAQAVYLFLFNGTTWNLETKLTSVDGSQLFGTSVSLSGTLALVGDYYGYNPVSMYAGAAYVFAFDGTSWTQQARLVASDGVNLDGFGSSVSLSGSRALIGAIPFNVGDGPGAAYLFVLHGTSWTQQTKYTANDGSDGGLFGISVSLSGKRSLVGAEGNFMIDSGAAYVFGR